MCNETSVVGDTYERNVFEIHHRNELDSGGWSKWYCSARSAKSQQEVDEQLVDVKKMHSKVATLTGKLPTQYRVVEVTATCRVVSVS